MNNTRKFNAYFTGTGMHITQTWQKRYLVLRDSWTEESDTSLELYECSDSGKCHTVSLRHVMLVDVYHDSKSFPHAFIVFRSVDYCFLFSIHRGQPPRQTFVNHFLPRCTVFNAVLAIIKSSVRLFVYLSVKRVNCVIP